MEHQIGDEDELSLVLYYFQRLGQIFGANVLYHVLIGGQKSLKQLYFGLFLQNGAPCVSSLCIFKVDVKHHAGW